MIGEGDRHNGQRFGIAGEVLSGPEYTAAFARHLGVPVSFYDMPFDDGSCGSFMEMLGQQIVMLEAALQEPAGAAGVTLTVENGAILITPSP